MAKGKDGREEKLNFYNLAMLTKNNYSESELDEFRYFSFSPWRRVRPNQRLLVEQTFNPTRANTRVLGSGWQRIFPIIEKSIKIPNPTNSITINYKPKDGNEKDPDFNFTPNIANGSKKNGGTDEIYCDYYVDIKLWDPIRYFYSVNAFDKLFEVVKGALRAFIARKNKEDIIANYRSYNIDDIDIYGNLKKFREEYGLDIVNIGMSVATESKEIRDARKQVEISKQKYKAAIEESKIKILKSRVDALCKLIASEADSKRRAELLNTVKEIAFEMGLPPENLSTYIGTLGLESIENPNVILNSSGGNSMNYAISTGSGNVRGKTK